MTFRRLIKPTKGKIVLFTFETVIIVSLLLLVKINSCFCLLFMGCNCSPEPLWQYLSYLFLIPGREFPIVLLAIILILIPIVVLSIIYLSACTIYSIFKHNDPLMS